jgi:hypothetical protein
MAKFEDIREVLVDQNPDALYVDGHENALIGIAYRFGQEPLACYSYEKVIANLEAMGMSEDEAEEFFEFNIVGAWMGDGTPVFVATDF